MKSYIWLTILALCMSVGGYAKDECTIAMAVQLENDVPSSVSTLLEKKIREVVVKNGIESGAKFSYFKVSVGTHESSKEVLSGNRPLIALTIELQLEVSNAYTGEKFGATSLSMNGSGRSEQRAYTVAISSLKSDNRQLQDFLEAAKMRIEDYYNRQLSKIIEQANMLAIQQDYEQAMFVLSSIPTCCKNYDKAEKAMLTIFQKYVDCDCKSKLLKAQAVWNATQNREGALLAGAYLAAINPASSCADEVEELFNAINERIKGEWEFDIEKQRDLMKKEELRIKAVQTIGQSYGENQKGETITVIK